MTNEAVRWEKSGRVATVWLCNPKKRNAMGPAFWTELPQVMAEIGQDDELGAVALCAEGPAFSVGLDLKSMMGSLQGSGSEAQKRTQLLAEIRRLQASISSVSECPLPVVAALHGYCLGGAVDLATACDVRVGASDLTLSVREVRVAMVADVGTLQRLPRIVGQGNMAELVYTGKDVGAERCQQMGLVNAVHESPERAIEAAHAMAAEMADNSPLVLRGIKKVMRYSEEHSVEEGLDYVALYNAAFLFSDDLSEAFAAFMQKRPPNFKGK